MPPLLGQHYSFQHLTVDDGLPSSTVWWMMQDHKGYVWMGTEAGPTRFDGRNFSKLENEIANKEVFYIFEDSDQRIWFLPFLSKVHYLENDSLITLEDDLGLDSLVLNMVTEDESGGLWFSSMVGLAHFPNGTAGKGNWKRHISQGDKASIGFKSFNFYHDESGRTLTITDRGILTIFPRFEYEAFPDQSYNPAPRGMLMEDRSFIYEGQHGIMRLENGKDSLVVPVQDLENLAGQKVSINRFFEDSAGIIWIGTSSGLFRFDDNRLDTRNLIYHLPNVAITCIMEDDEHNLWISTSGDGVYLLTRNAISVYNLGKEEGLSDEHVTALTFREGALWMGHKNGDFSKMDRRREIKTIQNEVPALGREIRNFALGEDGSIWAASDMGLFYLPSNENESFERLNINYNKYVALDNMGNLLLANAKAIIVVPNNEIEEFKTFFGSNFNPGNPYDEDPFFLKLVQRWNRAYSIHRDLKGGLWYGNTQGFWKDGPVPVQIGDFATNDIVSGNDGRVFIATKGKGIAVWQAGEMKFLDQEKGLKGSVCNQLLLESDSVLWAATNKGLSRIHLAVSLTDYTVENFTKYDGIAGNEVISLALTKDTLFVGTTQGLSIVLSSELEANQQAPRVYLTNVEIWGKEAALQNDLKLPYSENDITIGFTGISYRSGDAIRYKYQLEGLETEWHYTDAYQVRYPPLQPGDYRFVVYSINENNLESLEPAELGFRILPPFWQELWFIALLLVILVGGVYLLVSARIRRIKFNAELHQQLVSSEQNALLAQMNPHFIFNALNSIQRFIAQNDKKEAGIYLSKFASLIRATLENSRKQWVTLKDELESLHYYLELEKLRFKSKLQYSISGDKDIPNFLIPPMLIQPFVENAVKHAFVGMEEKGHIKIHLYANAEHLHLRIEDNGIGIRESLSRKARPTTAGSSLGTLVTHERLVLLNQTLDKKIKLEITDLFDLGTGRGTRIDLFIPVTQPQ